MKMIYVGSLSIRPDRDSAWIREYAALGCEVVPFKTEYDEGKTILNKINRRFNIGKYNKQLQYDLLELIDKEKPTWVHFRLPIEFSRNTILKLKKRKIVVTQYFNDDPFSSRSPFGLHWKFRNALTAYDAHFVYRAHNIAKYQQAGAHLVAHCPPTYDPQRHALVERLKEDNLLADVAFIGHWEDDWRVDCLDAISKSGFSLILKGGGWDNAIKGTSLERLSPVSHAFGREYNLIYGNVFAGLCFFSKINNDSWTERALEIIAVGGVLVCERTKEAEQYFVDREEAYFFSSISELVDIIKILRTDWQKRQEVRDAGYRRLLKNECTINTRARQIFDLIKNKLVEQQKPEINSVLAKSPNT